MVSSAMVSKRPSVAKISSAKVTALVQYMMSEFGAAAHREALDRAETLRILRYDTGVQIWLQVAKAIAAKR